LTGSIDVGASQLIIDGKIKLKNDAQITRFRQNGLEFTDGSTLDVDVVVFATG
jgi:filamentous hemagglutinin family protein